MNLGDQSFVHLKEPIEKTADVHFDIRVVKFRIYGDKKNATNFIKLKCLESIKGK